MVFPQGGRVCNNHNLKFHVIKDIKEKNNNTKVIGHVFQAKCWENTIMGIACGLLMAMEIGKGKEAIIDI